MNRTITCFAIGAVACLFSVSAFAAEPAPSTKTGNRLGVHLETGLSIDSLLGDSVPVFNGSNVGTTIGELKVGYEFDRFVPFISLGLNRFTYSLEVDGTEQNHVEATLLSLTLEGRYYFDLGESKVKPYGFAYLGTTIASFDAEGNTSDENEAVQDEGDYSVLGIGFGAEYMIDPSFVFGGTWRIGAAFNDMEDTTTPFEIKESYSTIDTSARLYFGWIF